MRQYVGGSHFTKLLPITINQTLEKSEFFILKLFKGIFGVAFYDGQFFRTQLEARWAAFFDLAGWKWNVNPNPVHNWAPDFRITFPCTHSECSGSHILLAAVLPIERIEDFKGHPCLSFSYGGHEDRHISADSGAAFGLSPSVTRWEIVHGAGGGIEDVYSRVDNADALWEEAKSKVSLAQRTY